MRRLKKLGTPPLLCLKDQQAKLKIQDRWEVQGGAYL